MIVIFGGGGQVAQELSRICTETGVGARAFTRAEADVADPDAVARAIATAKADIVVNAAAYTNVDRAETEIGEAMRSNATGPAVLARICADSGLPLIQLSTDYVFDGTKRGAYVETDATAPLGAYGRTKLAGEDAIRACQPEHDRERGHRHGNPAGRAAARGARRPVGHVPFRRRASRPGSHFASRAADTQAQFTGRRPRVVPIATADYPTPARRPANSVLDSGRFARVFGFRASPW